MTMKRILMSTVAIIAWVSCVATVCSRANAQATANQAGEESVRELRNERIATLKEGIALGTKLSAAGAVDVEADIDRLSRQLVDAEMEAAASGQERIKILESGVTAAKKREDRLDAMMKAGLPSTGMLAQAEAKAYRLNLEIQLVNEKAKLTQP